VFLRGLSGGLAESEPEILDTGMWRAEADETENYAIALQD